MKIAQASVAQMVEQVGTRFQGDLNDFVKTMNETGAGISAIVDQAWAAAPNASKVFHAVVSSSGAGRGIVDGIKAMVGANLLSNSSLAVARFLLNETDVRLAAAVGTLTSNACRSA